VASLGKTPTFDEPAHIGAGLSYLATGEFKVNPQHPPLLKELAALPLIAVGVRWPVSAEAWAALGTRVDPSFQWRLGEAVLFGDDPRRVLLWSRLPMLLVAALLGWTVWAWGRQMLGAGVGLGALLLFALDPTLIAHGPLVTTDVGCAAFATLFLFLLWRVLAAPTRARLLLAGLALGAALAAKFSAVVLLPIGGLLLLIGAPRVGARRLVWATGVLLALGVTAAIVVQATYFFPRDPWIYLDGIRSVNADHDPTYWPYMAGRFSPKFWTYYLVTYALKEPLPSMALAAVGAWTLARPGRALPVDRAFVLLPPALVLASYTVFSHNLGMRYVIPALPFLHLLGGVGLVTLLEAGRRGRAVGLLLVVWLVVAAAGIFPDHLSYFNELACAASDARGIGLDGGARCGPLWLDDSNVDWGQGLDQLAAWLAAHPGPERVRLAYFGSVPPERFGVRHEPLDARLLTDSPPRGRYAVSAHIYARLRGALAAEAGTRNAWLLRTPPTAIVGHAYYIWDVP
jgi:hypothetical protein